MRFLLLTFLCRWWGQIWAASASFTNQSGAKRIPRLCFLLPPLSPISLLILLLGSFGASAQAQLFQRSTLEVQGSAPAALAPLLCPYEAPAPKRPASKAVAAPPALDRVDLQELLAYDPPPGAGHLALSPQRRPAGVPAIAFWGDSHAAAQFFSDAMLSALGWGKGDVAPSFIPPTMARAGVRLPLRKFCQASAWRLQGAAALQKAGQTPGPALAALENTQDGAWLWIDFRRPSDSSTPALQSLDIVLRVLGTAPSSLAVEVDGAQAQTLTLAPGAHSVRLQAVAAAAGMGAGGFSQLRLRVDSGRVQIDGYAPRYTQAPSLVLDVFGIPGAVAKSWHSAQPEGWQQLPRAYDLLVLEYGTNEGADAHFSATQYQASLRRTLGQLRTAYPKTPCLLIGPTDRGVLPSQGQTRLLPSAALRYSQVHAQIASVQRELAADFSCGFWDWQASMGGMLGAYHWYAASPKLMAKDLIHLSVQGYQRSGQQLVADMQLRTWLAP
jgi:lysophospholipase L1-like esterase